MIWNVLCCAMIILERLLRAGHICLQIPYCIWAGFWGAKTNVYYPQPSSDSEIPESVHYITLFYQRSWFSLLNHNRLKDVEDEERLWNETRKLENLENPDSFHQRIWDCSSDSRRSSQLSCEGNLFCVLRPTSL